MSKRKSLYKQVMETRPRFKNYTNAFAYYSKLYRRQFTAIEKTFKYLVYCETKMNEGNK